MYKYDPNSAILTDGLKHKKPNYRGGCAHIKYQSTRYYSVCVILLW